MKTIRLDDDEIFLVSMIMHNRLAEIRYEPEHSPEQVAKFRDTCRKFNIALWQESAECARPIPKS